VGIAMAIILYNSLSGSKEEFVPAFDGEVGMYVCGPTVYDLSHVGHARCYVFFDVVRRYLEFKGFKVTYVQNFTDIDEKITDRARREGVRPKDVSERYINAFMDDMKALNVRTATTYTKVTDHIEDIVGLTHLLMDRGFAYELDGTVYFDTSKVNRFGTLTHSTIESLLVGALVSDMKRNPMDFVLWRRSKEGEQAWDSPWGLGRPGWHTECAAMASRYLRIPIDIHGGGEDLKFPHHESEATIAEAAFQRSLAKYWMHNNFVTMGEEKMSKSSGMFATVRSILQKHRGDALRYCLLKTHYRKKMEFSEVCISEAEKELKLIRRASAGLRRAVGSSSANQSGVTGEHWKGFLEAMDDDFDSGRAIDILFGLAEEASAKPLATKDAGLAFITFEKASEILGVDFCRSSSSQ